MERDREWLVVSVLVANYLHDAKLLDPNAIADEVFFGNINTVLDGDIPARIRVEKKCYDPTSIKWHLWPDEPGRSTWGTMVIHRFGPAKAILGRGTYDRARKRSPRLAEVLPPNAKRGLSFSEFERHGIATTF